MTAAESLSDRKLIRRIADRAGLDERTVRNALSGWRPRGSSRRQTFEAAQALGVDVSTVAERSDAENGAWLVDRMMATQRRGPRVCQDCVELATKLERIEQEHDDLTANALPEGYAIEECACGRGYPRLQTEAEGWCPKCWRRAVDAFKRERDEARAESEGLLDRLASGARPVLSSLPGGKAG